MSQNIYKAPLEIRYVFLDFPMKTTVLNKDYDLDEFIEDMLKDQRIEDIQITHLDWPKDGYETEFLTDRKVRKHLNGWREC